MYFQHALQGCIGRLKVRTQHDVLSYGFLFRYCSSFLVTEDLVRDRILKDDNKERLIKRLSRIQNKTSPPADDGKEAGVLMPLCIVDGQLSFLYTLRSSNLSTHAGQVSFPGGVMDKTDPSIVATALRETREEIGICPTQIDVWTKMTSVPDRRKLFRVTPVLGFIQRINMKELKVNREEVEDVFVVPVTKLLQTENQGCTVFRNGWTMPVFHGKHYIWGLTAIATDVFLANAFPDLYKLKIQKYHGDITTKFSVNS